MFKIFQIILFTLIMTSCSQILTNDDIVEESSNLWIIKEDFFVDIKNFSEFNKDTYLIKSWIISSNQDIVISSQVNGRIKNILKKEWDTVKKWEKIILIEDNIAHYKLNVDSAKNNLDKAKLNYSSNEIKLNKIIDDIEVDIANSQIDNEGSSSSLELEKINNSIKKISLDYENMKIWNLEQIEWFKNSFKRDINNFSVFVEDVIDFSDVLLWVTQKNKDKDDIYQNYLWVKNSQQLNKTKTLLKELIIYKENKLKTVQFDFEWTSDFNNNVAIISQWYVILDEILVELSEVLDNSITSIWSLSESQISWFKSQVSVFSNILNWNHLGFVSLENALNWFLETYINTELSLLKQIELLEQDKKIFIKWLDYKIDRLIATLEEAKLSKKIALKNLNIIITDWLIAYKQAFNQYNKLTITSPIDWFLKQINIDVWQEINLGTPLFSIVSNDNNLVEIWFTQEELKYVKINDLVKIQYNWKTLEGYIYTISQLADKNLKYSSKIKIKNSINLIWNIVSVNIPIKLNYNLIPINIVKIGLNNRWIINIYKNWEIFKKEISLWNIYNNKIEVKEIFIYDFDVIMNFTDNFDSDKFNLKIKDIDE